MMQDAQAALNCSHLNCHTDVLVEALAITARHCLPLANKVVDQLADSHQLSKALVAEAAKQRLALLLALRVCSRSNCRPQSTHACMYKHADAGV